ncbi:MFS transporter [Candidatus Spongiihabitans sp.]|uniref:MFS transporter n=1 Tax=Candidatus Spongiihabitans sp. TaxID=3101308 RepID=UPI003C7D80AD
MNTLIGEAGNSLAKLNALDGFSRAVLVGVVPLLALEALGSKQAVTLAYLLGSIMTLMITLNFAALERLLQRRWVVTLGGGFLIAAAFILYLGSGLEFAVGIGLRSAAASLFSVCLSLYIMDYIGKKALTRIESRRMVYNGAAWLIGPSLGIWLWNNSAPWTPFFAAALGACAMLAYFWRLRLGPNKIVRKVTRPSVNPLKIIPRYFKQPALRIAYLITLSRAMFWVSLFIYGPIYAVEAGLPNWVAGGLLSLASALLFFSPMYRSWSDKFGSRAIIIAGQLIAGLSVSMLFLIGEARPIGLAFWMAAAFGAAMLDVLGNIPFMRLVKARERTEMTMIFSTWREGAELVTPLAAALILTVAPFHAFYLFLGGLLLVAAVVSTYLPRRL